MTLLALQSDSRGLTALLVEPGKSAQLLGAVTVARVSAADAQADALKAALPALRGTKLELLVGLGPDEARVRTLTVPPAPEEELPTIVAMQAGREASTDADGLVVDFIASPADEQAPGALVCWAEAATISWWRDVASRLGAKLTVVTPRPLGTTHLMAVDSFASALLATRAGDDLDFVALKNNAPMLVRSARAPEDNPSAVQRELRRTRLSLTESVEDATLFGEFADAEAISWPSLALKLGAEEASLEVLRGASCAAGLALAAINGVMPSLNLAEPRRAPVAETGRRRQTLLAVATAAIVAAGGWMAYERMAVLDRQIANKQAEIDAASDDVEAFEPFRERVTALDAWRQSDVTWLDELERLGRKLRPEPFDSKDFPVESDLRAIQVMATAVVGGDQSGGRIDLAALARSSSTSDLESRLRDAGHVVEPISTAETPAKDAYRYKYSVLLRSPAAVDVEIKEATPVEITPVDEETVDEETVEEETVEEEPAAEGSS